MYRKDLKMARGEGEPQIKSHFVERVVKLPMVNIAWDYAANTYSHIKESNKLVNFTLTNAEKSVTFVAGQAKPVVLKFEKQIQVVDNLACIGLGTLEEKVPFIKKPAEEIIGDTRKLYTSTVYSRYEGIKKLGNDTVKSAADFGLKQATAIFGERIVQSVLSSVDGVLVVTQNYVDYVLPPTEAEKKQSTSNGSSQEPKEESTLSRLTQISSTVRRRTYRAAQLRIEYIQEKTIDVFVIYPFTLIDMTKTNLEAAVQYANRLWASIQQEESQDTTDNVERSRVEQQLVHLARLVSRQVATTYSSLVPLRPTESNESQEPGERSGVPSAVSERVLWVYGMLKLVPQLLPMYVYGFASWLEELRKPKEVRDQETIKVNGVGPNHHDNAVANSFSSDSSIPEEDEDGAA